MARPLGIHRTRFKGKGKGKGRGGKKARGDGGILNMADGPNVRDEAEATGSSIVDMQSSTPPVRDSLTKSGARCNGDDVGAGKKDRCPH